MVGRVETMRLISEEKGTTETRKEPVIEKTSSKTIRSKVMEMPPQQADPPTTRKMNTIGNFFANTQNTVLRTTRFNPQVKSAQSEPQEIPRSSMPMAATFFSKQRW